MSTSTGLHCAEHNGRCCTGTRQDEKSASEVRALDETSPTEVQIGDAVYNGMGESFRSAAFPSGPVGPGNDQGDSVSPLRVAS